MSKAQRAWIILGVAALFVIGGIAMWVTSSINANIAKVDRIIHTGAGLVETAKEVDVDKVRDKTGELADKSVEKLRGGIRILRDEWKK